MAAVVKLAALSCALGVFLQNARPLAKGLRASGKRVDAFEKYP